jgi:hypothetical protein|tara:strand:+ start:1031 stop:1270 length:240 start_codon:yes stop_codon:yes gene_type:complete
MRLKVCELFPDIPSECIEQFSINTEGGRFTSLLFYEETDFFEEHPSRKSGPVFFQRDALGYVFNEEFGFWECRRGRWGA